MIAPKADSNRTQSLPWVILSGVIGLYAVGNTTAPVSGTKDAPKSAIAKAEDPAGPGVKPQETDTLLKPFEQFYGTHDGRWKPENLTHEVHGYTVEFVIATVPDPIDTPFGYAFDQVVDAIQRGVQQKHGYVLDRSWLPWEIDRKVKPGTGPADLHEKMPGVLLFRHGKDEKRGVRKPGLCVVFLVGETPLGGIHKPAFWQCLKLIERANLPDTEPIRVVGPYFTGSQTSLGFLLEDWFRAGESDVFGNPRKHRFRIVFGNASAIRAREFFRSRWGPDKLEVGATVVPARLQLNAILHFLSHRDRARTTDVVPSKVLDRLPGRVAILTESNTGFGKQFAAYGENNDAIVLRFPLHISRLKSEYAQVFRKKDEQAGLVTPATIAPSGFEDAGGFSEGVPSQGGAATTAANNAVLANILGTISRERYRYVGVLATDTRDKLFLIRLIREFCPDVHVFVTEADVLLTHPDYRYHMKGVIVGSTYPMYPPNQQWVNPQATERLLMSSAAAQGYYNATLAVLGMPEQMLEYGPPGFAFGKGVRTDRPPVWVSMVAPNGALVPMQLFTEYEDAYGYVWLKPGDPPEPAPTQMRYPASLYLSGLALVAFWLLLAVKCWQGRGIWASAATAGKSAGGGVFRTVLFGAQMLVAAAAVAVASVRVELAGYDSWEDLTLVAFLGLAWIAFLFLAARGLSLRRPRTIGPESRAWRWNLVNAVFLLAIVAFTVAFLHRFWFLCDRPHRALFFVRAVDLGTGLSPLTPLLLMCLAITAGAYFQLERRDLAQKSRVASLFPSDADHLFDRLTDQDRRLKVDMTPGRFWKRHRLSITGLFAGLVLSGFALWRQSLPTVEGSLWDAAFSVGFWGIYAFAAMTILQTVVLWRSTRTLLGSVSQIPMMRVFARLPGKVSSVVHRHFYTRATQPMMLQMTVHQLRLLADAASADEAVPEVVRGLGSVADAAESKLRAYSNPTRGQPGDASVEASLRNLLSDAAACGLAALSPRWKALPTDEAFGAAPATAAEAVSEPAWVPRAEELVATQLVNYLSQFFIQLRSLMLAVLVCSSLLLLAATSYPFHPERLLLVFLLGLVGVALAVVMYVFLDMSRDETISRVAKTTPGKVSLDNGLLGQFFTYIVPTLGILVAQLSGSFRWLLEPILRVVK